MYEKLFIGFVGACIALILRELILWVKSNYQRKMISNLCVNHLSQIKDDLKDHVIIEDGKAKFHPTQYCETVVGDFLYELITKNISVFDNIDTIKCTIEFFHHYKVNMSTVQARLESSDQETAYLSEATYNKLLTYLQQAIDELKKI